MNTNSGSHTIFSLSSGAGVAGVAVIRVSGPDAKNCIKKMCKKPILIGQLAVRKIYHPIKGHLLDEGLVLCFSGPNSFTGEDVVELQIHGGRATILAVTNALSEIKGFRQAEAGEFTRQAFHNGRLDLVEVEGLSDLIHAQTEAQRRQALNQSDGVASLVFNRWRQELIAVLGYLEASIDFIEEEDVNENALKGFNEKLIHLRNDMEKHIADSVRGEVVRGGVRVVLIGEPNVGKSSIINYLARRDVAIVSEVPGTTRDILEVQLDIDGIPVTVSDTAGLREFADDEIEKMGIARTKETGRKADLLICVTAAGMKSGDLIVESDAERILVVNKIDLLSDGSVDDNSSSLTISAKTGQGMDLLMNLIAHKVSEKFGSTEPALISRERQKSALVMCINSIDGALHETTGSLELITEQLRMAANHLGRLVGRIDVEDLLDVIFRDFCVGK